VLLVSLNDIHLCGRPLRKGVPVALMLGLSPLPAFGQTRTDPTSHKSRYHLFNPTPPDQMREMSTDRPDQTESPNTVDAGHFQVEMDLVAAQFDRNRSGGGDVQTTGWGTSLNVKMGLLNNLDIQFVFEPYAKVEVEDRTVRINDTASGLGDFQTRLKLNAWGNDGGQTSFAIMPFVKWPLPQSSLRNGKSEGGVILPLAIELPRGWSMCVMTEVDFVRDGDGSYDPEYFNTITFAHDIVGNLGGYIEFAALITSKRGADWQGQVDVGFTYGLDEDTQLDFGCNFGLTKSAPDFNPFIGLSWRL
jgi:hypothetical protein